MNSMNFEIISASLFSISVSVKSVFVSGKFNNSLIFVPSFFMRFLAKEEIIVKSIKYKKDKLY